MTATQYIKIDLDFHAAHAIIFGVAPRFLSPVKKMLRVFAMLYDFFARDSFFFSTGSKKWCRRSSRERLTNFDPKIMSCAPPKVEGLFFVPSKCPSKVV